jgi:hypothetical protein
MRTQNRKVRRYDQLTLDEWVPNYLTALKDVGHPDPKVSGHAAAIRAYVLDKFGVDIDPLAKEAQLLSQAVRWFK